MLESLFFHKNDPSKTSNIQKTSNTKGKEQKEKKKKNNQNREKVKDSDCGKFKFIRHITDEVTEMIYQLMIQREPLKMTCITNGINSVASEGKCGIEGGIKIPCPFWKIVD